MRYVFVPWRVMGLGLQPRMRYTRLDNLDKRGIVVVIFNLLVKIVLKKI